MRVLFLLLLSYWSVLAQVGPGAVVVGGNPGRVVKPAKATGSSGQTQTDNFTGTSADLGANWTVVTSDNPMMRSADVAIVLTGGEANDAAEYYSGVTWTANQSSEAKIVGQTGVGGGAGYGVTVRNASAARTYYRLVINADGQWELGYRSAGTYNFLASGTTTYSAGAVLKLSAIGTTITSTYNGSQIDSRTDSNIPASGSPGVVYSSVSTGSIDDWSGSDGL